MLDDRVTLVRVVLAAIGVLVNLVLIVGGVSNPVPSVIAIVLFGLWGWHSIRRSRVDLIER